MNQEATPRVHDVFATVMAPWLGTANDGDYVIRNDLIARLAQDRVFVGETLPTRIRLTKDQCRRMKTAGQILVGGTNLLSTYGLRDAQWPMSRLAVRSLQQKLVLVGVGWRRPEQDPVQFVNSPVASLLSQDSVHSVRDSAAARALKAAGLTSLVTGCPSLLPIPQHVGDFSLEEAVVTVTDYHPVVGRDRSLVQWARRHFSRVRLQPQGEGDAAYAKAELEFADEDILPKGLTDFQRHLDRNRPVYVGTRLHGGIAALQAGLPTVILGIDNRATDMGEEFDLPVAASPSDLDALFAVAQRRMPRRLHLAHERTAEFMRLLRLRFPG